MDWFTVPERGSPYIASTLSFSYATDSTRQQQRAVKKYKYPSCLLMAENKKSSVCKKRSQWSVEAASK
ncbi:hypothetical protein RRG08_007764 [Elysia crispata]|uniref:Uncharacterized protein n=1 Tax=Elysia crispata TaxID=231223 RepID=A0AAE1E9X5_9GAST|nr:hypothetical protein RRG08_007764 [Elysia crispata]